MVFGLHNSPLAPAVAALRSLPLHIDVELRRCSSGRIPRILWDFLDRPFPVVNQKEESLNARLQSLRMEASLIDQRRREELAEKEQGDQTGDILEATVEMRSLMVG